MKSLKPYESRNDLNVSPFQAHSFLNYLAYASFQYKVNHMMWGDVYESNFVQIYYLVSCILSGLFFLVSMMLPNVIILIAFQQTKY